MSTAWTRIESGHLETHELAALRLVGANGPIAPCYLRNDVNWPTLRDLAQAGLVEMRNTDGEQCNPHDIEFAVTGGWLGVQVQVTDAGWAVLS